MEAELLLGRSLNLDRARAAALMGDQATLAEEIAGQVGTAEEFSNLNVIQQKALADVWHLKSRFENTKNDKDGHHEDEPNEEVSTIIHHNRLLPFWIWSCSMADYMKPVATYQSVMSSDDFTNISCFY